MFLKYIITIVDSAGKYFMKVYQLEHIFDNFWLFL